jgi:hypothetical protein
MTQFLGTYDFKKTSPEPYTAFLAAAERHGWYHWITDDTTGKRFRLPNTTVQGDFINYTAAAAAFDVALNEAARAIGKSIMIEKWFIAERGASTFSSDTVLPKYVSPIGLGIPRI